MVPVSLSDKKGFTMPELMVLLLVLSIMLAAAAPIVSRRQAGLGSNELPVGAIIIWYGAYDTIPKDYQICNGTNGTPNLIGRFPVGAGGLYAWNSTGGTATHTLDYDELPSHSHGGSDTTGSNSHTHGIASLVDGKHVHNTTTGADNRVHKNYFDYTFVNNSSSGTYYGKIKATASTNTTIHGYKLILDYAANSANSTHSHTATTDAFSLSHLHAITTNSTGAHTHTSGSIANAGVGSPSSFNMMPPYTSYYYIMKME